MLFLLGCIMFFPALGQQKIIRVDEARHAEIAREMVESGEYIVPQSLGHLYKDKPPLFNWTIAALFTLTHHVDFGIARLPSAFAAIIIGIVVYFLGRRWFTARAGIWAAMLWFTFPLVIFWGRLVRCDMVMTCLILCGILMAVYSADSQRLKTSLLLWFFACLIVSAAMLSKGPQALFFFFVAECAVWRAYHGRWVPPISFWAIAAGVFLLTATTWIIACELRNPGYIKLLLGVQFGKGLVAHPTRFSSYAEQLFLFTVPWGIFAAGAFYFVTRHVKNTGYTIGSIAPTILIGSFLGLMIVPNKRDHYLLPILPMWALFIAAFLDQTITRGLPKVSSKSGEIDSNEFTLRWLLFWPLQICLIGIALCAILSPIIGISLLPSSTRMLVIIACAGIATLTTYGVRAAYRGQIQTAVNILFVTVAIPCALYYPIMSRYYWQQNTETTVVSHIARKIPLGVPIAEYNVNCPLLYFTMNRPVSFLQDTEALSLYLKSPGRRFILLKSTETSQVNNLCSRPLREIGTWSLDKENMKVTVLELLS